MSGALSSIAEETMDEHEIEELWRKQHAKDAKNQFRVTVVHPAEGSITGDKQFAWGHTLSDAFEVANQYMKERMLSALPTGNPMVIEIEEKQGKKRIWHLTLEIKKGKWKRK